VTSLEIYFASHPVTLLVLSGILGLIVGSFVNVVILRVPVMLGRRWREQCHELLGSQVSGTAAAEPGGGAARFDLASPASHCPHCGHRITALENVPVLSFLWLRGKCSGCGRPISWRYPLVWHFGFSMVAAGALLLTWCLIALAVIDYDTQLLPDSLTLPLLWAGLLFNLVGGLAPVRAAVIGAAAGYLALWAVYQVFRLLTGKEGMGYGDFKLLAALGAWLGWQGLPLVVVLASVLGALVGGVFILFFGRDHRLPIPFGPFLCAAGWAALLWGDTITRAYLQYARVAS
jgi:leader peptidase (prepilin peptidase) / N-methyltransferase